MEQGIPEQDRNFLSKLQSEIQKAIIKAAQPLIDEALKEIEAKMKEKLASIVISRLDFDYDVMRNQNRLAIFIRRDDPVNPTI